MIPPLCRSLRAPRDKRTLRTFPCSPVLCPITIYLFSKPNIFLMNDQTLIYKVSVRIVTVIGFLQEVTRAMTYQGLRALLMRRARIYPPLPMCQVLFDKLRHILVHYTGLVRKVVAFPGSGLREMPRPARGRPAVCGGSERNTESVCCTARVLTTAPYCPRTPATTARRYSDEYTMGWGMKRHPEGTA